MKQTVIHGITAITRGMNECFKIAASITLPDKFGKRGWPQGIITSFLTISTNQAAGVI
jgi:hypothetical protein